jgi:hypothetical protein
LKRSTSPCTLHAWFIRSQNWWKRGDFQPPEDESAIEAWAKEFLESKAALNSGSAISDLENCDNLMGLAVF